MMREEPEEVLTEPSDEEVISSDELLEEPDDGNWRENLNAPLPSASGQWAEQLKRRPLLTREQEIELAQRVEQGDAEARRVLIESNLKLVVSIARRYRRMGVPLEDLIQEGNIGLIKAVDHYDYRRGTRFSTCAVHWIEQHIRRSISHLKGAIYVPQRVIEELYRLNRAGEELTQQLKRPPTVEELSEHLQTPVEHVKELMEIPTDAASLDVLIDEEMETSLGDILKDENATVPDDDKMMMSKEELARVMSRLTPRERKIIEMRFGLNGEPERTLEDIGQAVGLSRQRVRQILETTLRRIRRLSKRTSKSV
ncbi:MAG: RNA polymerase sigma factor RpoD/SigA [Abditibacteriales bacterium]|nr:RNA polymerase sigma factor RpoD/SigA [Abditibacteriales bacterium]MDW8367402.1 RNA polymerase sigma factor RpoD/SigA [Abditibacteriales bacterium]